MAFSLTFFEPTTFSYSHIPQQFPSCSMLLFPPFFFFFFWILFPFFFSRYLAISGLMPPVIFPRIVSFDTSNFILRVLHARITRICCHFLSSLLFIFFSPFLLDDNDEPLLAVVIIIKEYIEESYVPKAVCSFLISRLQHIL